MSLIKCSECGKEISDHASACPSCGNPIMNNQVLSEKSSVTEIELTNKKWKKTKLWSIALFLVGFFCFSNESTIPLGILLILVAFVVGFIARIGAWWTNG